MKSLRGAWEGVAGSLNFAVLIHRGKVFCHMDAAPMMRMRNVGCHMVARGMDGLVSESVSEACPSGRSIQSRLGGSHEGGRSVIRSYPEFEIKIFQKLYRFKC